MASSTSITLGARPAIHNRRVSVPAVSPSPSPTPHHSYEADSPQPHPARRATVATVTPAAATHAHHAHGYSLRAAASPPALASPAEANKAALPPVKTGGRVAEKGAEEMRGTSSATRAAWAMLNLYAREMSLLRMRSVTAEWIGGVDARIIAVALGRERSEIEILRGEIADVEREDGEKKTLIEREREREREGGVVANRIKEFEGVEETLDARFADAQRRADESGAQQMLMKSAKHRSATTRRGEKRNERRLMHEAAWCWIEAHLDHYGKVFKENMANPNMSKATMWNELVAARKEKEGLAEVLQVMVNGKLKRF